MADSLSEKSAILEEHARLQLFLFQQERRLFWNQYLCFTLLLSSLFVAGILFSYRYSSPWFFILPGFAGTATGFYLLLVTCRSIKRLQRSLSGAYKDLLAFKKQYLQSKPDPINIPLHLPAIPRVKRLKKLAQLTTLVFSIMWLLLLFLPSPTPTPKTSFNPGMEKYFENIRKDEAALAAFFSAMPKGGDLHNHLSGSVYAENYLTMAEENGMQVDTVSFELFPSSVTGRGSLCSFGYARQQKWFYKVREKLFKDWSIKDYFPADGPADRHFFRSFDLFPRLPASFLFPRAIQEVKERAVAEHVQYIETMLSSVPCNFTGKTFPVNADELRSLSRVADTGQLRSRLGELSQQFYSYGLADSARVFLQYLSQTHTALQIDDDEFVLRYQAVANRNNNPLDFFKSLLLAFECAASKNPLVVGVNILSQEDADVSMKDYDLHMYMFRFCHQLFPTVKFSMHAGELAMGLVKPEDLTHHINKAVRIAGAARIGHGTAIGYERNSTDLLNYMQENGIAVEINLWSNDYILGVRNETHPLPLYLRNRVPIVISTDDAGVLRSNLVHQFVLLATRYPSIRYKDIRSFILNSIAYSFIKEPLFKQKLKDQLEKKISDFEAVYPVTTKQ